MECLRCQGTDFFKADQMRLSKDYRDHISPMLVDVYVCCSCGHVEMILPKDQIEKQKAFIVQDRR